jgi:hypothetical protein
MQVEVVVLWVSQEIMELVELVAVETEDLVTVLLDQQIVVAVVVAMVKLLQDMLVVVE